MKFKWLTGDVDWIDYGGKWISPKQTNEEWEYYLVIDFTNMRDMCSPEAHASYHVSLDVVSPAAVGDDKMRQAITDCGLPDDQIGNVVSLVEVLHTNGLYAVAWSRGGNNARKMLAEARHWANRVPQLFAFYMDRPQNKIGSTGWDLVRGDVMAGLDREPDSPTKALMRKIQGRA